MLSSVKVQGPLPGSTPGGAERRVCRAGTPATPCCLAKYSVQREEPSFWSPRSAGSPAGGCRYPACQVDAPASAPCALLGWDSHGESVTLGRCSVTAH